MEILCEPKQVKARKKHKCDYCQKVINPGEQYMTATYKDSYVYRWKTCKRCESYTKEAFLNKDYDFEEGMGQQDFQDYMWEKHQQIATEWWE